MNVLKSEVKIGAVHEIGCRLDDSLENITKDLYRTEGAASVWSQVLSMLESTNRNIDKEIDEGKLSLEVAKQIRDHLRQLINSVSTSNKIAEQNKAAVSGKVQALQMAIQITKTYKDEEMNKLHVLQAAIAKGYVKPTENGEFVSSDGPRPDGVHPGMSLKQKRLAEQSMQNNQQNQSEDIKILQISSEKEQPQKKEKTPKALKKVKKQ